MTHWIDRGIATVPADAAVLSGPGARSVAPLLSLFAGPCDVSAVQEATAQETNAARAAAGIRDPHPVVRIPDASPSGSPLHTEP
jgi:hypothetical protein